MKITKSYLKQIIKEELEESTQMSYDPNPGKDIDGSTLPMWTSKEVPDSQETTDNRAWSELLNKQNKTPDEVKQIVQQAKADPKKAISLAMRAGIFNGKIVVAGDEQLGKLMSAGQFGSKAREIAKNALQKRSSGNVSRAATARRMDKMYGGTGKDVDLGQIGAPVPQIREGKVTKSFIEQIIKEELNKLKLEIE